MKSLNRLGQLIVEAIAVALLLGFAVVFAHGQTMSPAIVECKAKCSGEFTISNHTVGPLNVTVEPHSFSLGTDGGTVLRALDPTVDVQLDSMSARVGPLGDHSFSYKLRCSKAPCLVILHASMTGPHTKEGVAVRLIMPHVIYMDEQGKGARARARAAAGLEN
jgi:hypothetical protein